MGEGRCVCDVKESGPSVSCENSSVAKEVMGTHFETALASPAASRSTPSRSTELFSHVGLIKAAALIA